MAPKTKEQYKEIRQKSIAAIKQAALELFAHNGYHSTSISQIAREAAISKGLIYNYFSGKEELLNTIIMDAVGSMENMMENFLATTKDPVEQLTGLTEASVNTVKANLHYWKLLTSLAFQTDALKELEPVLKQKQDAAFELFIDIFKRLGVEEPKKEAFFYGAAIDGMMIHYMQMEKEYPLDEMKAFILKHFLK